MTTISVRSRWSAAFRWIVSTVLALVCLGAAVARGNAAISPEQEKFFEEKVRPVLANRCFECHGAKKQESGLRLDYRDGVLQGGDSGEPAAVAGNPDESLLITAVRRTGAYEMPPTDTLPAEEIDALAKWVEMGLPWPASDAAPVVLSPEEQIEQARKSHWAFQPIRRPPSPQVQNEAWPITPVDRYVLAKLEAAGLRPSPEADRRTLLRRVTFDLIGLPPTPEEAEAFLSDRSPDAFERVVERLLASPRYGERWGRHWLDVARYADTKGYAFAQERRYPYSYTYRDYVIRSFNDDLPYDRFVLEQLAADLLPPEEGNGRLAAMGFLTVGRKFNNRHDDLDDQIDVVSRGLLGLTVSCARCHDHKFDPIPTEDYYSLYGVFASSEEPETLPLLGDPSEAAGYDAFMAELNKRRKALEHYENELIATIQDSSRGAVTEYLTRAALDRPEPELEKLSFISLKRDELRSRLIDRWRRYLESHAKADHPVFGPWKALLALPDEGFSQAASETVAKLNDTREGTAPGQVNPRVKAALQSDPPAAKTDVPRVYGALLAEAYNQWKQAGGDDTAKDKIEPAWRQLAEVLVGGDSPTTISRDELRAYVTRAERNRRRELEKKIETFQANSPNAPPRAMVLAENENPHNPRVFVRGNPARAGDPVPRRFLAVLEGSDRKPFQHGSGRLELAQEIVADDNPLTARVIVNRVWGHYFGEPIVSTTSDFGVRTEKPVQADVLDYLAWRLRESGWSLKTLHREVVLSAVYRQASNAEFGMRNAESGENIPHSALRVPHSVDPENQLLWRMNRKRLEFEPLRDSLLYVAGRLDTAMGGRPVDLVDPPFSRRRAVYGFIDRQDLPNLFRVFDLASPDQSAAGRPVTTVPQQALFLMNSPFVIEQAKAAAARQEVASAGDHAAKAAALYRVIFSRVPTTKETEVGVQFIQSAPSDAPLSPWEQYAQLLLMTNEFAYVD